MSYHGYGQVTFKASVSTSGGATTGGPTGPKAALPMGPQCPPGYKPNASLMFTPTALLPPSTPLVPHCLIDKAAPAPVAPAPAQQPYAVKPGILATLFAPKPPAPVQTVLRSGQFMPVAVAEAAPIWPWLLLGAVVVGGGGYYWYSRRKSGGAAAAAR